MTYQKKAMPLGSGLDRVSGGTVVNPEDMNDLRNVHLVGGRTEFRYGLTRMLLFPAPYTDLLGVYLVRAQGLAAAVLYDSVTRRVDLWAVDSSGAAAVLVDNLWTLPVGATSPPRVSATDSYDQLTIAHDEPIYPLRQNTIVFSAIDSTVGPLMLDLGRTGSAAPVKFRGVKKHLAYIVAWGVGQNNVAGQEDRGEVLRISMPGEPTNFIPEHYFLVGTQGDPIIGCEACNGELAVQKIASSFKLIGYDRQSFGIRRLDPSFGVQNARLSCTVNDELFFWSLTGPRSTSGGPSADLGLPLALDGPAPDALATAVPSEMGFAFYDAVAREVVFCFGQWGYVLHLKDGNRRWSYRPYAVALNSAGLLYVGGTLTLPTIVAHPEPGVVTYIEPATYAGADVNPKLTIPWTIVGGAVTTEQIEIWIKPTGGAWKRKFIGSPSALTATLTLNEFQNLHSIAMRFVAGGFAGAGYTSADPSTWPDVSRTTKQTDGQINTWTLGKWKRFDASTQGYDTLVFLGPMVGQAIPSVGSYRLEESLDNITFTAFASGLTAAQVPAIIRHGNTASLTIRYYRLRFEGVSGNSNWVNLGPRIVAPEPPNTVTVSATPRVPNNVDDAHDIAWTAPVAVGTDVPADGPYESRGRHTSAPSAPGAWGATGAHAAGVHARTATPFPLVDPSTGGVRTAEANVRVALVSGDVSPWTVGTLFEP